MPVIDSVFRALLWLALVVLAVYAAIWFLGVLGIAIPGMIAKILWAIVVLLAIWFILRIVAGAGWLRLP